MLMKEMLKDIWSEPFNRYLIVILGILALFLLVRPEAEKLTGDGSIVVEVFHLDTCPHCHEQAAFFNKIIDQHDIKIIYHDFSTPAAQRLAQQYVEKFNITRSIGTPFTVIGDDYNIGFDTEETTGQLLIAMIEAEDVGNTSNEFTLDIPFIGSLNALDYSLPTLAIVLGAIDGFNPCAMWVLVYLITVVATLKDRRKIWLLVGSFVAASGILYFLFMTAWLNVFLFLGFMKPVTIIIGMLAIGFGLYNLKEFFSKKEIICKVGDAKEKKKTMDRIQKLVHSPLTWTTVGGMIVLAFIVNSLEFVCSAAIPAVFTQVLAISGISTLEHYGYILLYTLFFMLDDLIIFSLAVFAINSTLGQKYVRQCKLIGGVILFGLGIVLAFAPHLLQ